MSLSLFSAFYKCFVVILRSCNYLNVGLLVDDVVLTS